MSNTTNRQCACGNPLCDQIAVELHKLQPHIYRNEKVRVKKPKKNDETTELRLRSYRQCIKYHLNLNEYYVRREFYVAQHHWAPNILSFMQQNPSSHTISKSKAEELGISTTEENRFISSNKRDKELKYHLPPTYSIADAKSFIEKLNANQVYVSDK